MAWVILFASVTVLWVASLFRIFLTACSSTKAVNFNHGRPLQEKNVLLVIAHPDDESMFFTPAINHLTSRGHNVHLICLSTGNADGMGCSRKDELYKACAVLKIPLQQVKILDHPDLQDGFGKVWNHTLIAGIIKDHISSLDIDTIITFDDHGISGHCNHRDVHFGTRKLLLDLQQRNIEAWELISTSILRKYSGPVDVWLSMLLAMHPGKEVHCFLNEHPFKSFLAMAQHYSQWVWFRKLFVCLSSYTYVNTLRKIKI